MVKSGRAKRMEKHHKRNKGAGALNLVSLMDIFTILVFFLLVNSGSVNSIAQPAAPPAHSNVRQGSSIRVATFSFGVICGRTRTTSIRLIGRRTLVGLKHSPLQSFAIRSPVNDAVAYSGQPSACSKEPSAFTSKTGALVRVVSDPIGNRPASVFRLNQSMMRGPLVA